MAEKSEKAVTATAKGKAEAKFPLETLRNDCMKLFKVSSSTFAGATVGLSGDKEYTLPEVKTHIDAWLKKGVKSNGKR